jgi:hypothetical protein
MGKYFSISEGLRIPSKLEQEKKGDYLIVKQYQFEKWSNIKEGSNISKSNLLKVINANSDRFFKIRQEKILIAEDALSITATLDPQRCVPQGGVYFGIVINNKIKLRFVLGILNAKLLSFIYKILFSGMHMGGGYLRYRTKFLEQLPIPNVTLEKQLSVISPVNQILSITKDPDYPNNLDKQTKVTALESQIDKMVYELYDLTPKEIEVVEGKR